MPSLATRLQQELSGCPGPECYWVAYSGGMDSHVLLHALVSIREALDSPIGAVHVDHGLHADAGLWKAHCRRVCKTLAVPFVSLQVDARHSAGESPEAAARTARYAALQDWLPPGGCLLTAQHRDDQAETLLLQLLRGSGVKGLAAMPAMADFGAGQLRRPLLGHDRQQLLDYALENDLDWVDDPSNQDTGLDRNFLRHRIMPELRERWPGLSASLARSARHCAEAARTLAQLAVQDLATVAGDSTQTLQVSALQRLSMERRRNALRHWFMQRCGSTPSTAVFERIVHDVLECRADAEPCVRWGGHELRRYRDQVYLLGESPGAVSSLLLEWQLPQPLALPGSGGTLSVTREAGRGIRAAAMTGNRLRVGFRRGGERCRPAGRRHHHSLKKLFQEHGMPPWERARIPLIYIDNELAAVTGLWVCESFEAAQGEPGLVIHWDKTPAQS
jgi:tRNA(Ile)-lysidine synthase